MGDIQTKGEQAVNIHVPVKVKKLNPSAVLPTYATPYAAGADLYACEPQPVTVAPGETVMIHTGLAIELPDGYAGLVYARSGLALKRGLAPANKVGVIDSDYRGELMVAMHNHGAVPQTLEPGERLAQLIVTPYVVGTFEETDTLSDTARGEGGWGSTGSK